MPIEITARGADDNVLAQIAADANPAVPVTVQGSVRNKIEQVATAAAVGAVPAFSDANAIEWLAGQLMAGSSITLVSPGLLAAAGHGALDVSGPTASIALAAAPTKSSYSATQAAGQVIPAGQRRAIEGRDLAASGSWASIDIGLVDDPASKIMKWRWDMAGNWGVFNGNTQVGSWYAGALTDVVAVVAAGDGSVEFWRGGVLVETIAAYAAGTAVSPVISANQATGAAGDSMSATVKASGYAYAYGGAGDW